MRNSSVKPTALGTQPNENEYLWKYMTLQKFLSCLLNHQFHYAPLDQMEDMYEGINARHLSRLLFHQDNQNDGFTDTNHPFYERVVRMKPEEKKFLDSQKCEYVTCWITGKRESAGMWNLYSEPGGVALRITYKNFVNILNEKSTFEPGESIKGIAYGLVVYKNFVDRREVEALDFKVKKPAFRKDLSFEHEREFRVCISLREPLPDDRRGISQILTDFETLPIDVVLHPKSGAWQNENVKRLIGAFAPSCKQVNSELKLR